MLSRYLYPRCLYSRAHYISSFVVNLYEGNMENYFSQGTIILPDTVTHRILHWISVIENILAQLHRKKKSLPKGSLSSRAFVFTLKVSLKHKEYFDLGKLLLSLCEDSYFKSNIF